MRQRDHVNHTAMDFAFNGEILARHVHGDQTIGDAMRAIIDECSARHPHGDWETLRALPYDDLSSLESWIIQPFILDPPPPTLAGLWFGMFLPIIDGETVMDIYVCGSERFIDNPNDNSWAVGPDWWPQWRYAESSVLAQIYRITNAEGGVGFDAEYPLTLGYGSLAVKHLMQKHGANLLPSPAQPIGVAVGFDSGDFILLGRWDGTRFIR